MLTEHGRQLIDDDVPTNKFAFTEKLVCGA